MTKLLHLILESNFSDSGFPSLFVCLFFSGNCHLLNSVCFSFMHMTKRTIAFDVSLYLSISSP